MPRGVKCLISVLPVVLTASLLLVFLLAVPVLAQQPAGPGHPAGVPDDYVATPFGWFHPSCVRAVASGDTVLPDGRVKHADGTVSVAAPRCTYPHYSARGELVTEGVSPLVSGWVEDGEVTTATSYAKLSGGWVVPPAPSTTSDNQTLYFFPGMQQYNPPPNQPLSIIQPVLAWNGAYGPANAWGIASWNCCLGDQSTWYSTYRTVKPGDTIVGTMVSTCAPGTLACPTWNITTTDQTTGGTTTLGNSLSYGQTFNWAFAGALEAYNVNLCSDYPPNGSIAFSSALYDYNFTLIPNPGWSFVSRFQYQTPKCNYGGSAHPTWIGLDYGLVTSPVTLNFGQHYTDEQPVYVTATLTNPGTPEAGIVSVGQNLQDPFLLSSTTCGATLGAGASCSITVEFDVRNANIGTNRATMVIVFDSGTSGTQLDVPLVGAVRCRYNCQAPAGGF